MTTKPKRMKFARLGIILLMATRFVSELRAEEEPCLNALSNIHQSSQFFGSARTRIETTLGPFRMIGGPVSRALGVAKAEKFYEQIKGLSSGSFEQKMLEVLGGRLVTDPVQIARFPKTGPVIVTAIHPTGPRDVVILEALRATGRSDIKIMTTIMLQDFAELQPYAIFVDNLDVSKPRRGIGTDGQKTEAQFEYERRRSERREFNDQAIQKAEDWVKAGHVLVIFPAGAVSYLQLSKGKVLDPKWRPTVARLIRASKANVVPAHISGRNSAAFQVLGQLPTLRTMFLFREFLNKKGQSVSVQLGDPIPYDRLKAFDSDRVMVDFLRAQTYGIDLARRARKSVSDSDLSKPMSIETPNDSIDIRPHLAPLARRLQAFTQGQDTLPEQVLAHSKERMVFVAYGNEIPLLIEKLGDRRAINFSRVGEGSGKRDNDRFDLLNYHIVSYNLQNEEIEGAYRIGVLREIYEKAGLSGIYLREALKFPASLIEAGPLKYAAELGRAFVEEKYEGEALYWLWKGIAEFLYRKKDIMFLTGVVSLSTKDYTPMEIYLATEFMKANHSAGEIVTQFKPRTPPKFPREDAIVREFLENGTYSLEDVERLVLQVRGKALPPLLRFYSGIGAKVLRPNHDKDFGSVDVPVLLNLYRNSAPLVKRAFGTNHFKEMQEAWGALLKVDSDISPSLYRPASSQ